MGHGVSEVSIARPADEVWAVAGQFGDLHSWMPGIESCEVAGDDRTLKMMGMTIVETLRNRDDAARTISYSISGGDVSVDSHQATITVHPDGDAASRVTWEVDVEPDSMTDLMQGTYQSALDALKARLEG